MLVVDYFFAELLQVVHIEDFVADYFFVVQLQVVHIEDYIAPVDKQVYILLVLLAVDILLDIVVLEPA